MGDHQISQLQIDVAVIREQTSQIKLDIQEIKELAKRVNELEHFRTKIRVWGTIGWTAVGLVLTVLSRKVFG